MHGRVVIRIVLNIFITIISFNSLRCFCYFVLLRKLIDIPKLMTSSCFWWAPPSTDCWRNKGYYKQNCSVTVCCHSAGTIVCGCVSHQCVSLIVSAPFIFILLSMSRHMTGNLIKWNWISSVVNSQDSSRILCQDKTWSVKSGTHTLYSTLVQSRTTMWLQLTYPFFTWLNLFHMTNTQWVLFLTQIPWLGSHQN